MAQGKGVYKRGSVWWLTYTDAAGRVVRETSGTSDYKAALKELAKARNAAAQGIQATKQVVRKVRFSEAIDEYLKWAKPQKAYANKAYMKTALVGKFGNIPLHRFNIGMLEGYQQELLSEGKAPATINRRVAMLKHLFHKANDWGWVDDGTLRAVRKVKMLKEPAGRLRYLSPDEVQRLLAECRNPLLKAVVTVALNTGMRQGEILGLKWENVDLRNGFILIGHSKNGDRREIPINGAVRDVLGGIVRRIDSGFVFCDGQGMAFKGGRNAFVNACRRAGLHDFHFHDLRHSAASFMAMAGIDLMSIKQILGHKTIQMTLRYSHLTSGHLRKAVDAIDQALTSHSDPTSQFTSQSGDSPDLATEGTSATACF